MRNKPIKELVKWLEGYNEFCHANNKFLGRNHNNELVLTECSKKFYYQSIIIERILNKMIEKKIIKQ